MLRSSRAVGALIRRCGRPAEASLLLADQGVDHHAAALPYFKQLEVRMLQPPSPEAVWKSASQLVFPPGVPHTHDGQVRADAVHMICAEHPWMQEFSSRACARPHAAQTACRPTAWEARSFASEPADQVQFISGRACTCLSTDCPSGRATDMPLSIRVHLALLSLAGQRWRRQGAERRYGVRRPGGHFQSDRGARRAVFG